MQSERRVLGYDQQFAEAYDDIFSDAANNAAPVEFLAAAFAGADTLLELGAGTGRVALPLIDRGFRVIAVDDSAAMLQRLRAKSTGSDDTGDNAALDIRQADMAQLPGDIRADGVYSVLGSLSCLLDDDARRRTFASARDCVSAGARFVIEVYNPPVVHAMHSAHPDPIDVDTEYPGGSALRSRYRISGDGKLWMAEHRWETDDATTSQFGETVALVDPLDLIALASPWWRPVALLNDWQGEPVGSPPGPMLVLVLEAVGGREAP